MERVFLSAGVRCSDSNRGASGGSGRVGGGSEQMNAGRRVRCGAHVVRGGGVDLATFQNLNEHAKMFRPYFENYFGFNHIFSSISRAAVMFRKLILVIFSRNVDFL